ncbi:hypothetical protein H2200_008677 [Cladophialophora chaetospira]|uniref:Uncharacterized protein n=1 Tax=Cladophialophora chaetospira TaxID=386627 RepID=A0AA39CFT4_9EURO|nr:hypothetical protein H2200_008677 [Cladophialophora chaetospira]
MAGRLLSRTALITGTSSGLGRAIALAYAREGANIVCTDLAPTARALLPSEDPRPTDELVRELGGKVKFVKCDISDPEDVKAAVGAAVDTFERLDIREEELNLMWLVINIASVLSLVGMPGSISYVASKGAVMQITKTIALEYAANRIHCNAICPGFTKTTLLGPLLEDEGAEKLGEVAAAQPFGGIGRPEDIAKAAVFLASDDAAWVTGIPLPVDGGYVAR